LSIGREPNKQQPNNGLGSLFNRQNAEAKRLGQIQGISPISVKTNAAGTFISWAGAVADPTKWVEITDSNETDPTNKYSWVALKIDPESGEWSRDETSGTGLYSQESGYAIEVAGCKHVLWGYRCRLYKEGSNYSFQYVPEVAKGVVVEGLASGSEGDVKVDVKVNGSTIQQTIKARYDFSGQVEPDSIVYCVCMRDTWVIIAQNCPLEEESGEE
jgi:hypothetical protein